MNSFNPNRQLYLLTGKGGVGKTSLALALSLALREHFAIHNPHKKIFYFPFKQSAPSLELQLIEDSAPKVGKNLQIAYEEIQSAEIYIGRKLHSELIARFIMSAPFFRSLFHMLPSLSYMILLGHMISDLKNDPNLTIVIDAPASGHANVLLDSMTTFQNIFKSGVLVDDIFMMKDFLNNEHKSSLHAILLPQLLSLQESMEMLTYVQGKIYLGEIFVNQILPSEISQMLDSISKNSNHTAYPHSLIEKYNNEKDVLSTLENTNSTSMLKLPYVYQAEQDGIGKSESHSLHRLLALKSIFLETFKY